MATYKSIVDHAGYCVIIPLVERRCDAGNYV